MTAYAKRDPLLVAARILTCALMGVFAIVTVACVIALVAILTTSGEVASQVVPGARPVLAIAAIVAVLLLAALLLGLCFRFVQLIGRIIDSVGQGDPFVPQNADRMQEMAWIALVVQPMSWAVGALAVWIGGQFPDEINAEAFDIQVSGEMEISLTGFALVLVLFILARVFRKGAEMRTDLEGTV